MTFGRKRPLVTDVGTTILTTEDLISWMVPVDLYRSLGYRFGVQIPKGTVVRKRRHSSRSNQRSSFNNDIQDTYSWDHVGIGSGKMYLGHQVCKLLQETGEVDLSKLNDPEASHWVKDRVRATIESNFCRQLLVGNDKYPINLLAALERLQWFKSRGIKRKVKMSWSQHVNQYQFRAHDFIDRVSVSADGILGPKKLINGYVQEVYVHFIYPKWERKREARYKVLFETGASGIFTSDFLEPVFDTDYDMGDEIHICDYANKCSSNCTHGELHTTNGNCCNEPCWNKPDSQCVPVYEFDTLMDTTCGKALDYVHESYV